MDESVNLTGGGVAVWTRYGERRRWGLLAVLFLISTSSYFDYYVVSVLLDPIKREFGVSDTLLGLLSGFCFALCYAVTALPIARWADRGNRRTVIVSTLAAWSVLTMACGAARSFWQLAITRLGVGAVEPGAVPPSQSLLADYFPPERRAMPIALLIQGGSAAGWLIAVSLGGYIAAMFGWRAAFMVAGLFGVPLAVVARWVLSEPREGGAYRVRHTEEEPLRDSLRQLANKRSYLLGLLGLAIYAIFAYAVSIFLPSFMIRSLHASLLQISVTWGFAISGANLAGALLGGWLADALSRKDVRWHAWLPAIGCLLGIPLYGVALRAQSLNSFIALDFVAEAVLASGPPIIFAAIHGVCGTRRRATAIALFNFSYMLIGSGLGPLVAGALSDGLNSTYGADSLRYSLQAIVLVLLPASAAFYGCARAMRHDLED